MNTTVELPSYSLINYTARSETLMQHTNCRILIVGRVCSCGKKPHQSGLLSLSRVFGGFNAAACVVTRRRLDAHLLSHHLKCLQHLPSRTERSNALAFQPLIIQHDQVLPPHVFKVWC